MSQVLPDFVGDVAMSDKSELPQVRDDFRQRARAFLKRSAGDEGAIIEPKKKRHRVASMQWLLCLDNSLQTCTGKGIEYYKVRVPPEPWAQPYLSVAADQGSDGICAAGYCQFGPNDARICLERLDDPSHSVHNDVQLAVSAVGLHSHQLLMGLARNTVHGPWDEGTRFVMTRGATAEYSALMGGSSCPLMEFLAPRILDERGESHRLSEKDIMAELWADLIACPIWVQKGTKLSTSRFLGPIRRIRESDCYWSMTYLGFLYICLVTGTYSVERLAQMMPGIRGKIVEPTQAADVAEQPRTAIGAKDEVGALRKLTKNQLELATVMYGNYENRFKQAVIGLCARPLEDRNAGHHGKQHRGQHFANMPPPPPPNKQGKHSVRILRPSAMPGPRSSSQGASAE